MRILFIVGATPPIPCGVGHQVAKIAERLSISARNRVALYTCFQPRADPQGNVRLYGFGRSRIRFYLKLLYIIARERPEVTQLSFPNRGFEFGYPYFMVVLLRVLGRKVVLTFHEPPPKSLGWRATLLKRFPHDAVAVRDELVEVLAPTRCRVITNGSPIPQSRLSSAEAEVLKRRIANGKRLCAHFGFIAPARGIVELFDLLDPREDHLLLIGALDNDEYSRSVADRIWSEEWVGNVSVTGYLEEERVANLLYAADVVILPFKHGSHSANTSTKATVLQGTYLITTSLTRRGYDAGENTHFVAPDDWDGMRHALERPTTKSPWRNTLTDGFDEVCTQYEEVFAFA